MSDPVEQADTLAGAAPGGPPGDAQPEVIGGRYLLEERIASGGMAAVWRAHDELLARTVAVKILHDHLAADAAFRERFRREAVSAAKLSHPNVVSLYDTGVDGERVYLVMEFVDGSTLRDVVAERGRLDPEDVAAIGEKVARALGYAHQRGLVHRDVKPANILIGVDGTVKVADFGIAKAEEADDGLTKTGMVLGTAAYVAPEQILSRPVDGRTDQYGLGIVLYEALTGRQPFHGDSPVATAALRLEKDPMPVRSLRADVPRGLDQVVMRLLAREPEGRYPTAEAVADALLPWNGGPEFERTAALTARPEPAETAVLSRPSRREATFLRTEGRWLVPVLGLLVLAGLLVGVGLATGMIESDGFPIRLAVDRTDPGEEPEDSPQAPVGEQQPLTIAAVQAFDPPPGDGRERDRDLPNLFDGDPASTWRTERYNTPAFGGLKDGVGFWVDLGQPQRLTAVHVVTTSPGVDIELRVAEEPAGGLDGWQPLPGGTAQGIQSEVTLRPEGAPAARYILVWITGSLQPGSGGYLAELAQVAMFGEPE